MVKQLVRERRSEARVNRVLSIEHRLCTGKAKSPDAGGVWHLSTTEDVGSGGLTFYSDHEYRIEDILEIRIVMAGVLDVFKSIAKVVRVERKQMAASYRTVVRFVPHAQKPRTDRAGASVIRPRNRL